MARIEDLLTRIDDPLLRAELEREVSTLKEHVDFGIVFERHIPETVDLLFVKPAVGDLVRLRRADGDALYRVFELRTGVATLTPLNPGEPVDVAQDDLLVVKPFGEPIYPSLTPLGQVARSDDRPFHSVINGENLHALQLLRYLYEGSVDCIYIDPPYNTGARDWKYNNRFVDENDTYRHSKWLAMMERRLRLAEKLIKPDGVLICTIDENELSHLGMLLEAIFPSARRQLVSIVINPSGAGGEGLSRVEEYAFVCFLGGSEPIRTMDDMLTPGVDPEGDTAAPGDGLTWESLLRRGNAWYRERRRNLCYPVLLDRNATRIVGAGEPLEGDDEAARPTEIDGLPVAWPVRRDGRLGIWRVDGARLEWLAERGYAFVGGRDDARGTWALKYLMSGAIAQIESGEVKLTGRGPRGEVQGTVAVPRGRVAKTVWYRGRHTAGGSGGTQLLSALLGARDLFPFPKSVYAVRDALEVAIGNRSNAVILDFFAGSGTTLHATLLMNNADGGRRRCILVTNNEVSEETAKRLQREGSFPGDPEFEAHGVFESVARPRTGAAIAGLRPDGQPVSGSYLDGRSCAEGFDENVEFYRLDYLNPDDVELGRAFEAIHPALWLIAGAKAPRPDDVDPNLPFYVADRAGYAILFDDTSLKELESALEDREDVTHAFVVTDSEEAFIDAREAIGHGRVTSMIYRDYLRTFRINTPGELA